MYSREKQRKSHRNTASFSSTLLDEIYRSIDGGAAQQPSDLNGRRWGPVSGPRAANGKEADDLARARLVDRWVQKRDDEKEIILGAPFALPDWETSNTFQDNDLVFFSSTSTSAGSFGSLSYSDTEFFVSQTGPNGGSRLPKPIRVTRDAGYNFPHRSHRTVGSEDDPIKPNRSTAAKIYANLKKMKQPVSPGARLTSFLNSLFTNGKQKSSVTAPSNGSDPRSCMMTSGNRRDRMGDGNHQRTVRFHPDSVINGQDSKKSLSEVHGRPPLPPNRAAQNVSKGRSNPIRKKNDFSRKIHHEDDDEDARSDSSSDLFELDHSALFGGFDEQLPVYETVYLDKRRTRY